jgi:predicted 3-demethylubiquinone-9 3-methyltransferase (glyoxalase superfamily)
MAKKARITPCLWFDDQAEQAARYYVKIFKNSKLGKIARYGEAGKEQHRRPPGSVMIVEFVLDGTPFTALNGGPVFQFNEAVSLQVYCKNQKEVDYYWDRLGAGGDPKAQVCGWLKDKYGLSWQIVSEEILKLVINHKSARSQRAMAEMMRQRKPDIAAVRRAYDG